MSLGLPNVLYKSSANCRHFPTSLRAIIRAHLVNGPVGTASSFTENARKRLRTSAVTRANSNSAVFTMTLDRKITPTESFQETLAAARTLMGVGLGFEALSILTPIVRSAQEFKYEPDSALHEALIWVDSDIAQAIQSCQEQIRDNLVEDQGAAETAIRELRGALNRCRETIKVWGGEFPFEKGDLAVQSFPL